LRDEELGPKGKRELQDIIKSLEYMRKYFYFKMSESVNEASMSDIDIIAQEAKDFKDFVIQFYKEYKDFPKTKESMKWLAGVYKNRSKMEGLK
jgi:hypothetical protein